ncbi:MAG: NAD(P)/FAD-dependent oxidoreductase, partial [Parasphingopyxis sp.]|uniref:NAD(P)/FAD-dependent oxidoreductase n=1 Tax=Parasphingopyxis sp. TaxID=1920299 RepID=UPI003F9FACBD
REVLVLEAENAIGMHSSSRNSEVIHAGIYYEPGSLKAELCRRGKEQLYRYAAERGIPHHRTGKLVVASSSDQVFRLEEIKANAVANGIHDLELISGSAVRELEPAISCTAALLSPSTGIIDTHAFMLALEGDLEAHGGMVVLQTPVIGATIGAAGIEVEIGGAEPTKLRAHHLVNCGGLKAPQVARSIRGLEATSIPTAYFAIGHYYRLSGQSPCQRLIYPLPEPGGLGIHLTVDLGGQAKFGPDLRWIDWIDYAFDDSRFENFLAAIREYLPDIAADRLAPDYTGIRPKIVGPGAPAADFRIDVEVPNPGASVINLFGIESPGLTASLAVADHVAGLLTISIDCETDT